MPFCSFFFFSLNLLLLGLASLDLERLLHLLDGSLVGSGLGILNLSPEFANLRHANAGKAGLLGELLANKLGVGALVGAAATIDLLRLALVGHTLCAAGKSQSLRGRQGAVHLGHLLCALLEAQALEEEVGLRVAQEKAKAADSPGHKGATKHVGREVIQILFVVAWCA
jgi:hypothetical protein